MKTVIRGLMLGILLVVAANVCAAGYVAEEMPLMLSGALIFFMITYLHLLSDSVAKLLISGFVGVWAMFSLQIFLVLCNPGGFFDDGGFLIAYVGGFFGSMVALAAAFVATVKRGKEEVKPMCEIKKEEKIKLLIYTLVTAAGFGYLVMPQYSSAGVLVFAILELLCLWYFAENKKRLIFYVPILIMAVNSFISSNMIWRASNFILSIVLAGCMFMPFDFKKNGLPKLSAVLGRITAPFNFIGLPFCWISELGNDKKGVVKRVLIAIAVSLPCAAALVAVLSGADMVFSMKTEELLEAVPEIISLRSVYVVCCSILAGLYMFGVVLKRDEKPIDAVAKKQRHGDLIIINILLSVVLFIYTLFAVVQFRYLFATSELPGGLSYTEYARKGFFELLLLTGVNIAGIITVTELTKGIKGKGAMTARVFCHYLCAITVLLLVSSFYRMYLYTNDDGLTRMRLYVMGFLAFEAIGLLITFVYIQKPTVGIVRIYLLIALSYYCVLNIVPCDTIIAYEQSERFISGRRNDISYVLSLSADAVPGVEYLFDNTTDEEVKKAAREFIISEGDAYSEIPVRWQRLNISAIRAGRVSERIKNK